MLLFFHDFFLSKFEKVYLAFAISQNAVDLLLVQYLSGGINCHMRRVFILCCKIVMNVMACCPASCNEVMCYCSFYVC